MLYSIIKKIKAPIGDENCDHVLPLRGDTIH